VSDSFEFFGGVQNLLDKQPPPVYSGSSASNTDEVVYDTLGRRYFMGAKISF
jgi:outer membrane receptor protein involved in Fe transport